MFRLFSQSSMRVFPSALIAMGMVLFVGCGDSNSPLSSSTEILPAPPNAGAKPAIDVSGGATKTGYELPGGESGGGVTTFKLPIGPTHEGTTSGAAKLAPQHTVKPAIGADGTILYSPTGHRVFYDYNFGIDAPEATTGEVERN
ncbi:MAG: hypothetical protein O2954_10235 [bacterium]|nr:hypothetical protein [bacterium]